jgi:hypothetical protein
MNCPNCDSNSLDRTSEFDLMNIDHEECDHDFVCEDCGALITIKFAPIEATVVGQSERDEFKPEEED